jgi:hypothetical protein
MRLPHDYWESWRDGFWICFGFGIAALLSFTIPVAVLRRVANAVEGGTPKALVIMLGATLIAIAGPIILSKVYRELEYPWMRKQLAKARSVDLKTDTPEV